MKMEMMQKKDYVSPEMFELELYHQGSLLINASEMGEEPEESGPIDLG